MDKIIIDDLSIDAIVGVHDWERKVRQKVLCSIVIDCDLTLAAQSHKSRRYYQLPTSD